MTTATQQIDFTRINNDINGNPRYVCHFHEFLNTGDNIKSHTKGTGFISEKYAIALAKAKRIGGRKFHNKQYGGGIVFQSYNIQQLSDMIIKIREVNTDFVKEWTPAQFKQAERAIYHHFATYAYKWQSTHNEGSRRPFWAYSFEQVDNLLGLAYTSTGMYAGLLVCNAGYLMANETHHFSGFAINTGGKVIGIVEDENENEIFIEL